MRPTMTPAMTPAERTAFRLLAALDAGDLDALAEIWESASEADLPDLVDLVDQAAAEFERENGLPTYRRPDGR